MLGLTCCRVGRHSAGSEFRVGWAWTGNGPLGSESEPRLTAVRFETPHRVMDFVLTDGTAPDGCRILTARQEATYLMSGRKELTANANRC